MEVVLCGCQINLLYLVKYECRLCSLIQWSLVMNYLPFKAEVAISTHCFNLVVDYLV
jgi:hypothetical protein